VKGVRRRFPVLVCCLALLVAACTGGDAGTAIGEPVAIDGPLPAVRGPELPGGRFTPAEYEGRVTVVNFWATWCSPCRREQPVLQQLWEDYRDRGVILIGVNQRDDAAAATAWLEKYDVSYPSVLDSDGASAAAFGFAGLPATYVADGSGELRYAFFGEITAGELTRIVDEVLADGSTTAPGSPG
jgi:cytochrome c biogenesis protein CcmG/thiol:disulfide interchange protein DsbE